MAAPHIYLLPAYANNKHLQDQRSATQHISSINYNEKGISIKMSETNSLVEDKYSMNIHAAKYELEGKEAMIHHHPQGHEEKHLQFRLQSEHKVIRIQLPPLDREDYERCIKGFIYTTKRILEYEQKEFGIQENLSSYFYNQHIEELQKERHFLLQKIQQAQKQGTLTADDETITKEDIESFKEEPHLLPFLEF